METNTNENDRIIIEREIERIGLADAEGETGGVAVRPLAGNRVELRDEGGCWVGLATVAEARLRSIPDDGGGEEFWSAFPEEHEAE